MGRNVYFVGHSAGGPIAVQAFLNALTNLENNQQESSDTNALLVPAGVVLIAPAILDPAEDPSIYDYQNEMEDNANEHSNNNNSNNNDDDDTKEINNNNNNKKGKDDASSSSFDFRRAVFKTVLSLPDAFGVPIVRRIYDGRNITEALLNQTYNTNANSRRRSPTDTTTRDNEKGDSEGANNSSSSTRYNTTTNTGLSVERANYLANKYKSPVDEFPNEWDVGLLNVYRADFLKEEETDTRDNSNEKKGSSTTTTTTDKNKKGRDLLCTVRETVRRMQQQQLQMSTNSDILSDDTEPDVHLYRRRPTFCVVSGDDDRVVPIRASRRVADILSSSLSSSSLIGKKESESESEENNTTSLSPLSPSTVYYEMESTGHLPMDEKPEEMANVLLEFILE